MERLERMANLQGLPATVKMGSPNDFYKELEATSKDLVAWRGELVCSIMLPLFVKDVC
jgi:hypothetical protein